MRKFSTIVAVVAAALMTIPVVATASTRSQRYEFDNGSQWTLFQSNAGSVNSTFPDQGYADAGVLVDIGPLSSLSGINVTGSGVTDNIWIGNGSEASTPGTHNVSDGVNFAYGFDQGGGQSFYMQGNSPYAGSVETLAQLQSEYPTAEAYAWVGVETSGSQVSGTASSVNGISVNRSVSITPADTGELHAHIQQTH